MAITPADIQAQTFSEAKRGYDPAEVDVFLETLSSEVDAMLAKIVDLKGRLTATEQQLADAVTKHTEDSFQRFSEDFRQEVSGIFALQIAAVKQNCFCNEFVLRAASVAFVVFLHPLPNCIFHPDCVAASFFCFHVQNLPKS